MGSQAEPHIDTPLPTAAFHMEAKKPTRAKNKPQCPFYKGSHTPFPVMLSKIKNNALTLYARKGCVSTVWSITKSPPVTPSTDATTDNTNITQAYSMYLWTTADW